MRRTIANRLCHLLCATIFINLLMFPQSLQNSKSTIRTVFTVSAAPSPKTQKEKTSTLTEKSLSIDEISTLRVREIKRQLALNHGYSNEEISKMLDKRELINALAFEEHKVHLKNAEIKKRRLLKRGIIVAVICVLVVLFWPVFQQLYITVGVNFEVYYDRKKYEISRCIDLRSKKGCFGMLVAIIIDIIQLWLSISVLLSWLPRAWLSKYYKYLFPTPNIPIRPAAMLGSGANTGGGMMNFGINVGPMFVTWFLRYLNRKVEMWIGKVLSQAHQHKQKSRKTKKEKKQKKKKKEVFMAEDPKFDINTSATNDIDITSSSMPIHSDESAFNDLD